MNETISALQVILEDLLKATAANRTTIRIDNPEQDLHMSTVLAEALAPGVHSIKSITSLNQRMLRFQEEHRCNIIQDDVENAELSPPQELIQVYGVKAQMLGTLVWNNRMIGFISVHYMPSTRHWSEKDIASLEDAKECALTCLEQAGWLR